MIGLCSSASRYQSSLSLAVQSKLIDTLLSALQAEIDQSSRSQLSDDPSSHLAHKEPLERYAFLIQWFIAGAERAATKGEGDVGPTGKKSKGGAKSKKAAAGGRKGDWVWQQVIPGVLKDLGKALKLKTDRIWTTTQERDTFIKCVREPTSPAAQELTSRASRQLLHAPGVPDRRERGLHEGPRHQDERLPYRLLRCQVSRPHVWSVCLSQQRLRPPRLTP